MEFVLSYMIELLAASCVILYALFCVDGLFLIGKIRDILAIRMQ